MSFDFDKAVEEHYYNTRRLCCPVCKDEIFPSENGNFECEQCGHKDNVNSVDWNH
jgi:hypothetical protein